MSRSPRKLGLVLAWVFFILSLSLIIQFSLDSGTISFSKSWHFVQLFKFLQRWIPVTTLHVIIRKVGHFTEYFIFGITTYHLISFYLASNKKRFIVSILTGLFVSCTDEMIQRFVSTERSGQILDILLDSLGVIFGFIFLYWLKNRKKKYKKHQENSFNER